MSKNTEGALFDFQAYTTSTSNPMKLLSCVTLQRSPTFSFLWVVQSLPASGSDQQQLYEYGTSCDPIKACHVIYVSIIDYSSDSVSVIWCHVMSSVAAAFAFNSTVQQHPKMICNIKYSTLPSARGNVGTCNMHCSGIGILMASHRDTTVWYVFITLLSSPTTRRTILSKVN